MLNGVKGVKSTFCLTESRQYCSHWVEGEDRWQVSQHSPWVLMSSAEKGYSSQVSAEGVLGMSSNLASVSSFPMAAGCICSSHTQRDKEAYLWHAGFKELGSKGEKILEGQTGAVEPV